jgi:hypothetical protein
MNFFVKTALDWAVARLSEASTWAGLTVSVEQATHINFNADFKTAVVHLGLSLSGLAAVIIKEGFRK